MTEKETTTTATTTMVEMTPEEKQRFEAFKLEEAKRKRREEQEANLNAYRELVDETVDKVVTQFTLMSEQLRSTKNSAIRSLMDLVKMKRETLGLKADGQWSYTFTKPDSKRRVTMGVHTLDGWQDTVEEGIEMVMEYIKGLASDDNSQALVGMVLKLLAKDASGNLKADKVLELRRIAEESGSDQFIDGVRLIEDSHFKTVSKIFLKAEVRNDIGVWERLPLNITEVATDSEAEQYLVRHQEGENAGDKVVEYLQPFAIEPIIIEAVRLEKGVDFLNQEEERERIYKCTVAYIVLNESTGKESKVRKGMYLYADDCQKALNCVEKSLELAESAGVVSIAQTKIIELI